VSGADRIEITPTDFLVGPKGDRTPYHIQGADKVRALLDAINIDAAESGFHCMCDGDFEIRIFKGQKILATLSYHHGVSLRWHNGKWEGDAQLTGSSREALALWFKKEGYTRPQEMREAAQAEARRAENETTRFAAVFPPQARGVFTDRRAVWQEKYTDYCKTQSKRIVEAVGNPQDLVARACRALSISSEPWMRTGTKEQLVLMALRTVPDEDFAAAMECLKEDRDCLIGAGRLFFMFHYDEKMPPDRRAKWAVRLAEITLTEGMVENQPIAVRYLKTVPGPKAIELLRSVMEGKLGKGSTPGASAFDEPTLAAEAALSLAHHGDLSAREQVKTMLASATTKPDRAALEVALALLGDPSYIRKEQFHIFSFSIGYAALEAVERYHGAYGMDVLIEDGLDHEIAVVQDQAMFTVERITGQKFWYDPENTHTDWAKERARAWWKERGEGFVKERREQFQAKKARGDGQ
jgi:hypothetical protein